MTAWTGETVLVYLESDIPVHGRMCSPYMDTRNILTTEKSYAGSKSLRVQPGGVKEVLAACTAGSRTISVYVWPPTGNLCGLQIVDPDTGATMGTTDWSASSGAWEQLSVAFTAESKIYVVRLVNYNSPVAGNECWFDALEVA